MAWNDTFTNATDWSAKSFAEMFWKARNERAAAIGVAADPEPAIGADVQSAQAGAPASTTDAFSWRYLQDQSESLALAYVRTNVTFHANAGYTTGGDWVWNLTDWRTAAGINASGFRRKRPREITGTTDATDTQGNSAAAGQRAWLSGILHQHDGAQWVPVTSPAAPDVLDSASAAPNHVAYGVMQAGDYIGPWVFTELRDGFNKLLWTLGSGGTGSQLLEWSNQSTSNYRSGTSSGDASWAASKANAETDWNGTAASASVTDAVRCGSSGQESGGSYSAFIERLCNKAKVSGVPTTYSRGVEWYVRATAYNGGTFDANGDGTTHAPLNGQWSLWLDDSGSPGTSSPIVSSAFLGNTTTKPVWTSDPTGHVQTDRGYEAGPGDGTAAGGLQAIVKWNVSGGFTYVP